MACVDADGLFLTIDVGDYGRNSDGRVFRRSSLGITLENNALDILEPKVLPGWENKDKFPHYFVADEAFPLKTNIMRPFPKRSLNKERRIYNYRCSRARRSVECSFGMLVSKFRLFEQPIGCKVETAEALIKAAGVLHNFIRIKEGVFSTPSHPSTINSMGYQNIEDQGIRPTRAAESNRDFLCDYFVSNEGKVPWQDNFS
ncbi:uncharacterized protein LOC111030591 [Myzus persicae]|uniref:uncharacterized protein LOC111030591 n=1 Tax=Myzus persicae TaxID=13164 RepID=UPI000B932937|nr:uncharacterized protein LOC111030591 [Myzus persicae]